MSKMLQVFTLSYPDSGKNGPKPMVLFTNFSAYETSDGSGDISFDEEEEDVNKDPQEENKSSEPEGSVSFAQLIQKFREDLVTKLMEDQSITIKLDAQKIVDKCLPKENFFAFKRMSEDMQKEERK